MSTLVEIATAQWSPVDNAAGVVLACAGATHVGAVRVVNEDALLLAPPVFVVADGIGGHSRGDVASALVVEAFAPLASDAALAPQSVDQALARSRVTVAAIHSDGAEPGATMVSAGYVQESGRSYWLVAHVGDSRAYSLEGQHLEAITRDHSVVQELIDAGQLAAEDAATHPERHVITRAIAPTGNADAEFSLVPMQRGQRLLLCSDGLTGEVSDRAIGMILANAESPARAVGDLVDAAVNMGGRDNVTVVVVDVLDLVDTSPHEDTVPLPREPSA